MKYLLRNIYPYAKLSKKLGSIYSSKVSSIIKGRPDYWKHALISQFQSCVNRVLAYDQTVLICHDDSSEAYVWLVALVNAVSVSINIFFSEGVSLVKSQIHLPDRAINTFTGDNLLEFFFTLRENAQDQIFISL